MPQIELTGHRPWLRHHLVASASAASPCPSTTVPTMAAAAAVAGLGTSVSPFPFGRRNLASSFSSFCSCSNLLPACFAPLVARSMRFSAVSVKRHGCVALAASAAGTPQFNAGENVNPYEILGISLHDGFDHVKMSYKRRRKDAEHSSDANYLLKGLRYSHDGATAEPVERGRIWINSEMRYPTHNERGAVIAKSTVSKDIRYADNQPIVPWGPRYSRSTVKDLRINMAISATFVMGIATMGHADWKPLQFLSFAYFYRIIEKLKITEPAITPVYNEYGEVEGRGVHMAKRVLRSLGLVLGSIIAASLGYTGLANFSQFLGHYIPSVVYNFQELIVTTASSVLLCILASYYR